LTSRFGAVFGAESLVDSPADLLQLSAVSTKNSGAGVRKTDCRLTTITSDFQRYCQGSNSPLGFLSGQRVLIMNESRLFVGNLAYQTMDNDLQDLFAQAGVVTSVNVMLDKFTGKSRGFAFVEMGSAEDANKAVEMFHNKEFQGRALTVNIARPREDRPPRSGGGGGYRGDRGDRGGHRGR
jgi:hypothetical protein